MSAAGSRGGAAGGAQAGTRAAGWRRWALKAGVSGGLLALLLVLLPWEQVRDAASRLSVRVWIGTLALFVVGHVLGAVKWRALVNACLARLGMVDAIRAYFAGLFANLYLPSIVGGDVLRGAIIGRGTGRPEAAVLGGIADRVIDIACMGILIGVGALLSRDALPGWGAQAVTVILTMGAVAGALFLPLALRRPLKKWPRSPGSAALALVLSLAIQSLFVALNAWIGRDVGIAVPLSVWFLVWPLAKVAGLMPISLGGIAVRDAALAGLLAPFGVPLAQGAVAGLLWQTINMAGGLVGGVVWWALGLRGGARAAADPLPMRPATPTVTR